MQRTRARIQRSLAQVGDSVAGLDLPLDLLMIMLLARMSGNKTSENETR
jgi:hypothetical protein